MTQVQTRALGFALPCLLAFALACASPGPDASTTRVYKRVDSDGVATYVIKRGDRTRADPIPPPRERSDESDDPVFDRNSPSQIPPPRERNSPPRIPPPLERNSPPRIPLEASTTEELAPVGSGRPEESAAADSVPRDAEESAKADSVLGDAEESSTEDSGLRGDVASPPPQMLLEEIADLEARIAADRERLKMLISEEGVQGGAGLADDERIGEISRRLPALQSELADLRRQAGQ